MRICDLIEVSLPEVELQERAKRVSIQNKPEFLLYRNPTRMEFNHLWDKRKGQIRGIIPDMKNVFLWDAYFATHGQVMYQLGLYGYPIYVSDSITSGDEDHDPDYYSLPNDVIETHPGLVRLTHAPLLREELKTLEAVWFWYDPKRREIYELDGAHHAEYAWENQHIFGDMSALGDPYEDEEQFEVHFRINEFVMERGFIRGVHDLSTLNLHARYQEGIRRSLPFLLKQFPSDRVYFDTGEGSAMIAGSNIRRFIQTGQINESRRVRLTEARMRPREYARLMVQQRAAEKLIPAVKHIPTGLIGTGDYHTPASDDLCKKLAQKGIKLTRYPNGSYDDAALEYGFLDWHDRFHTRQEVETRWGVPGETLDKKALSRRIGNRLTDDELTESLSKI